MYISTSIRRLLKPSQMHCEKNTWNLSKNERASPKTWYLAFFFRLFPFKYTKQALPWCDRCFFFSSIGSYGIFIHRPRNTSIPQDGITKPSRELHSSVTFRLEVGGWKNGEVTLPETNIAPENRPSQKETIVFQTSIFRGYVSFREGTIFHAIRDGLKDGLVGCIFIQIWCRKWNP